MPEFATAQGWIREAGISVRATATDNGALVADDAKRADFITSVQPGLRVEVHRPSLDLSLNAALELVSYARNTQDNEVLPLVKGALKATLVERLLFVDALVDVRQIESDPFGARAVEGSTANRRTASTYALTPSLQHEFSPRTSILASHSQAIEMQTGADSPDQRSQQTIARFDVKPVPVGFFAELSRLDNDYRGTTALGLTVEAARVGSTVTIAGDLIAGVLIGKEHVRFTNSPATTDNLYGLIAQWTPTPRTELLASAEHRFFGTGGQLRLRHRTPFTALSIYVGRELIAATSTSFAAAAANVSTYLDAILSKSLPDPVERAVRVQNQLSRLGLRSTLPGSVDVIADYPQLLTGANVAWVLSTPRTTVTLSAYREQFRQLDIPGLPVLPVAVNSDNDQIGAAAEFNRRLSALTSLDLRFQWSRIRGLGTREGEVTRESSLRLGLAQQISPRTGATIGAQYRNSSTNALSQQSFEETSVFAGLSHRF